MLPASTSLYPSPIDRYRLIQIIVRTLRLASPHLTGTALAKRAGVSQGTVSNLENLEHALENPKRKVSRDELKNVLTAGLRLDPRQVAVVLWLYDATPLESYQARRSRKAQTGRERRPSTRAFLGLLKLVRERSLVHAKADPQNAILIFTADPKSVIDEERKLLEIEAQRGQRLLVTAFPTGLARPIDDEDSLAGVSLAAAPQMLRRMEVYRSQLAAHGERSVHCKTCVETYLNPDLKGVEERAIPPWRVRRRHIENWIELLRRHSGYQIALADRTSDQEFEVKIGAGAMLRGWAHPPHEWTRDVEHAQKWGPRFVFSSDVSVQIALLIAFEEKWASVEDENKDKWKIVEMLERYLTSSRKSLASR